MPQKCRVKHMCIGLLEQAWGNTRAHREPCLQCWCSLCCHLTAPVFPSIHPLGRKAAEWALRSLRKTPKLGEVTQWFTIECVPPLSGTISSESVLNKDPSTALRWETVAGCAVRGGDGKQTSCWWLPHKVSVAHLEGSFFHPGVSGQGPSAVIPAFWLTLPAWAPAVLRPWSHFWTPMSSCWSPDGWGTMSLYTQQMTQTALENEHDVKKQHCSLHSCWGELWFALKSDIAQHAWLQQSGSPASTDIGTTRDFTTCKRSI